ncbi:MAG: hypothetical protein PHY47_10885 [Lachnospiraceae bacterium]|nr:hypothetical protein [Lachnospiraceae bacterium]
MKKPNLMFNYYFPFYTQKREGKKQYYYTVKTIMHLSPEEGILISLEYKRSKLVELSLRKINDAKILDANFYNDTCITYSEFSKVIKTVYKQLSDAIRVLSSSPAYIKILIFGVYFKYNANTELVIDSNEINIKHGEFDYKIENGKRMIVKKEYDSDSSDENNLMNKLSSFVNSIHDSTNYKIISEEDFINKFEGVWERYIEYFEAPKFIRKKEFKL